MSDAPLETSLFDETVKSESPDVPDPKDIEEMLKFVKQYNQDQQRNGPASKLYPSGISAWSSLPPFIIRKAHEAQFEDNEKDIPSSAEFTQSMDAITARTLDYDEFLGVYADFPASIKNLYEPSTLFRKLMSESDEHGRISVAALQDAYCFKINFLRYLSGMEQFSYHKPGYLTFEELGFYVGALIHNHNLLLEDDPMLNAAKESFAEIIFFKSVGNDSKVVKITDVLASGAITEFFDSIKLEDDDDHYLSIANLKRVYARFEDAKSEYADDDFLISQQVAPLFPSVIPLFWERFFEVYHPNQKMYFVEFYKLSYMLDNLMEPSVVRYLFKVLDIDQDGVFSHYDYQPFYNQMMTLFDIKFGTTFELNDMYASIFDMTQAKNKITVKDLLTSQKFDKFFAMVCDVDELAVLEELGEEVDAEAQE